MTIRCGKVYGLSGTPCPNPVAPSGRRLFWSWPDCKHDGPDIVENCLVHASEEQLDEAGLRSIGRRVGVRCPRCHRDGWGVESYLFDSNRETIEHFRTRMLEMWLENA